MTRPFAAALCLALAIAMACADGQRDVEKDLEGSSVASYTVRGRLDAVPQDDGEVRLTHEAIDDFVGADGEIVGMDSMTMSFPVDPNVDSSALAVGDIVELELTIDWSADQPATVTQIESLPEGTELVFRMASPPSDAE